MEHAVISEPSIIDDVVQLAVPLDGSIENFGGEVIRSYITTNCNGIATRSLDLVGDGLRLLFVEATIVSTMYGAHQHHKFTCYT